MNTLQKYLTGNAIFSTLSGTLSLVFQKKIERIFNLEPSNFFFILGILLIFFALTILVEIIKQRAIPVLWIIIQDILWVVGSLVLLLFNPFNISKEGNIIIGIVALVVLIFSLGQVKGLASIDEVSMKGKKLLRFKRKVKGSKSKVWNIISDLKNYHNIAPNIDGTTIVSGEKKGMVRTCSHGEDSWSETCTLWKEEKQYSFVIDTQTPDYPFPFKTLNASWIVNEISKNESEIIMEFEFDYKKPIQNILVHPLLKYKFTKVCKELLDNWQEIIEN